MLGRAISFSNNFLSTLPAFIRFGLVGGTGLATDMTMFTLLSAFGINPFLARIFSLAFATLVTWTLNRQITFDKQPRTLRHEASMYAMVTLIAQSVSYLVFVSLVLSYPNLLHQISLFIGAAFGAVLSFKGHKLFSFAPVVKSIS